MIEDVHNRPTNRINARVASRLARAASAEAAIPVISSETTSGTIVICSALSHMPPIGSATAMAPSTQAPPILMLRMPAPRPITRASRIRVGWESFKSVALHDLSHYLAYLHGCR
jgi:hypothetical protein